MIRIKLVLLSLFISQVIVLAGDAGVFVKRAQEKFKNKDYAGAIIEYSRAIEIDSSSAPLFNNRGLCKYKIQRYSDALTDYNIALILDSTLVNAHFNKGNCLSAVVEYEQALLSFDKVINIDSSHNKAHRNRAKILFYLEDYRAALNDYQVAIRLSGFADKVLFLERGNAYYMMREYELALTDYTKAITIDPEYYKAYINRGICKLDMGDAEGAIRDFTLSIRFNQYDGESYYYRAMANVYRMHEVSVDFQSGDRASLLDFKIYNELACSDLQKAKAFSYAKAYELIQKYCTD